MLGDGRQPHEAMISEICEAFGCTPDVAEQQDEGAVRAIMDYRALKTAKAQHNQKDTTMSPELIPLWMEVIKMIPDSQGGSGPEDSDG